MTSFCLKCKSLVPSWIRFADNRVHLSKNCSECGATHSIIERDLDFVLSMDELPRSFEQKDCYMVDITNKCSANCVSCYNRKAEKINHDAIINEIDSLPDGSRILISGGEPLEGDYLKYITYAANRGLHPVLLTNGAMLTPTVVDELLSAGLSCLDTPQIAVSLGLPGTNSTFDYAYQNIKQTKVADVAFTVSHLDELKTVEALSVILRDQFDSICIRTAWDGNKHGLFLSDMVRVLDGDLFMSPTIHGYRSAMVEKNGIIYKLLSWPAWDQYDVDRYQGRGVWYKSDNVVSTLVKRVTCISL